MIQYRKILKLTEQGISIRGISAITGHGRSKIREVIYLAKEKSLSTTLLTEVDDQWMEEFLYPHKSLKNSGYGMIDFDYVHKELAKPGVHLALLHHTYETTCRLQKKIPHSYRSFIRYYKSDADKFKATLRIRRKPGELIEVDWCGMGSQIYDRDTGEKIKAYIFFATLPCSQYSYAEATLSMDLTSWVATHQRAFEYFRGVSQIIVPDNLKTSVTRHTIKELALNPTYQEMCAHYNIVCMPT